MDLKTTVRVVRIQQMIEAIQWRECCTCKDLMPKLVRVIGEKLVKDLKLKMIDEFYV
jgi:hypothetical protein